MANTNKASDSEGGRSPFHQKETVVEKVITSDALSLMHGWRFVPDEIELKKRMLYALAVGFEYLSVWVYKQIIPYVDKYGSEDFETTIFPKLLQGQMQTKYTLTEIRQEIEKNIITLGKRMHGDYVDIFLMKNNEESKIKDFIENQELKDKRPIRTLYCLLRLLITEIEESDMRTIELIVFLGHMLDRRIFDYLITYFHKEKDLLLEILLMKMKYRVFKIPSQQHLTDKDMESVFNSLEIISYTPEEEEAFAKKIVIDLSDEQEISFANFFIMRGLMYIKYKPDAEILQKMIDKIDNKNKAVRMQCVIILQAFAQHKGVVDALIKALDDADDDIKNQARISLSVAIPTTLEKQSTLIDYYVKWTIEEEYDYTEQLADVLITAKKINHPKHTELYKEYCTLLEKESPDMKILLVQKAVEVFSLYIKPEDLLKEDLVNMRIEEKKNITFPSPELVGKTSYKKDYTESNAVSNLEDVINTFLHSQETVESVSAILPQLRSLLRTAFLEEIVEALYTRDPERNWRYWTALFKTTEQIKKYLREASKEKVRKHIKALTKHWASTVRAEATRMATLL